MASLCLDHTFEPVEFSDLTLIYGGARFGVHKCILSLYSTYFCALLKGDRSVSEIALVSVTCNGKSDVWDAAQAKHFFSCFYRDKPLKVEDFVLQVGEGDAERYDRMNLDVLIDFCEYFGYTRFDSDFRAIYKN